MNLVRKFPNDPVIHTNEINDPEESKYGGRDCPHHKHGVGVRSVCQGGSSRQKLLGDFNARLIVSYAIEHVLEIIFVGT